MAYWDIQAALGLAAIDFQVSSGLKKKLTDVFQMGIDFRDNLDYSRVGPDESDRKNYRCREVFNYFRNTVVPKFCSVVKEETGLIVSKIYCIGGVGQDPLGYFAVDLSMNDVEAAAETIERMTGQGNFMYSRDAEAVEDMKHMADGWDGKTGRITKSVWGKDKKISVEMYFDVNCAYLCKDFYPEDYAADFTAAELAAIMCHECGHANSVVEHSADMYVTRRRLENFAQQLKGEKDAGRVMDVIKKLIPWLQSWGKQKYPSPMTNAILKKAGDGFAKSAQSLVKIYDAENGSENYLFTLGNLTINLFCMLGYLLFLAVFYVYFIGVFVILILHEIERVSGVDNSSTGGKATDIGTNRNNIFLLERWADEYVVRHGLGPQLASGLNKLDKMFENTVGSVASYRLRQSSMFNLLCKGYNWLFDKICILSYFDPVGYENQYQRVKRIEQDTLAFFKNPNIPGNIADEWIRSVQELQSELQQAKKLSDTKMGKFFFNVLRTILSPVSWAQAIKDAKFSEDLTNILNEIDDFQNNSLYYQSYRFSNAAR